MIALHSLQITLHVFVGRSLTHLQTHVKSRATITRGYVTRKAGMQEGPTITEVLLTALHSHYINGSVLAT